MDPVDITAFDRLAALVVVLHPDGTIAHWNEACSELTGHPLERWVGRRFSELLPRDEAPRAEAALRSALEERTPGSLDCTLTRKDGGPRTFIFSVTSDRDASGSIRAVVLGGVDVTELVAGREADRARLHTLLEQAPDGIFVADRDGRYTDVNDAGCRLLGYSRDEIVGKTILDLIPPGTGDRLWREREEMLTGGGSVVSEWTLRRKDGSYLPVEVSAKILPDGRWQGFVRDTRTRQALSDTIADLNRAQSVAKVGSWRLDVTRNELRWTDENYRIFGVPVGTPMTYGAFLGCVHPDDRAYVDEKWTAALRGEPYDIEHRLLIGDTVKWVREKADLQLDEHGSVRGGIGVTLDITDDKRAAEEQRLLQERMSAIIAISADAVISLDAEQRIVLYNEGAERIFGWSRDEVLGKPLDILIPERLREVHRQHVRSFATEPGQSRAMGDARPAIVGLRKNGEEFPAEAAISKVEVGGKRFFTVTVRDVSDRQAIEQERERLLAEIDSERRWLRGMFDIVPMGILLFEPGGRLYFNRRTEEILGMSLSPSGGSAQYANTILYPDGRPVPPDRLSSARVLRTGETVVGEEFLVERPDGSRIPTLASAAPLRDSEGRIVGGIGVYQDITERVRAEERLRVSEERLRVSLSASPVIMWNQDEELRYTWAHNPTSPSTVEETLGRTDFDLLSREDAEQLTRIKRRVLETGVGARTIMRATVGTESRWFDLTVEPLRDAKGRISGITCATWDVTDQRRAEEEQRLLAEVGAVLMNAAPGYEETLTALAEIGVRELADWFIVDVVEDGEVRRLKAAHKDPADASLARKLEALPLARQRPHLLREPIEARRSTLVIEMTPEQLESLAQSAEHLRLLRALDIRSLVAVPLLARGRLLGALALLSTKGPRRYGLRDVVLAEQLASIAALAVDNAQLYRAARRAIEARDEILGIVAHDLRSPLSAITMQADLLRRPGAEPERRNRRPAETIRRSAERMDRMIQDMLDVARLEAGSLSVARSPVPTRNLLYEVIEHNRETTARLGLHLRAEVDEPLPDVYVDHDRLLQIFDNLIGNAVKFTERGGEIALGASARGGVVLFRVSDTGCGVSERDLPRLFDRFWQAERSNRRGAGLGLFIVKGLVEAHGGRIWVESRTGRGTTFWFTIPVAPSAGAHPSPAP